LRVERKTQKKKKERKKVLSQAHFNYIYIKKQFLYKWVSITNMSFMDGGSC
jgi:hypothetical protein